MNLADALVPKQYAPGELIIKQGDSADGMYFLEDGTVRITMINSENQEKEVCAFGQPWIKYIMLYLNMCMRKWCITVYGTVCISTTSIHFLLTNYRSAECQLADTLESWRWWPRSLVQHLSMLWARLSWHVSVLSYGLYTFTYFLVKDSKCS